MGGGRKQEDWRRRDIEIEESYGELGRSNDSHRSRRKLVVHDEGQGIHRPARLFAKTRQEGETISDTSHTSRPPTL